MLQTTMTSLKAKKNSKKGFTLMEMLIVVAIIGILVAIAIPTFSNSLNKAKVAADQANLRSYYAESMTKYLTDGTDPVVVPAKTQTVTVGGSTYTLYGTYAAAWDATNQKYTITLTGVDGKTYTIPSGGNT